MHNLFEKVMLKLINQGCTLVSQEKTRGKSMASNGNSSAKARKQEIDCHIQEN